MKLEQALEFIKEYEKICRKYSFYVSSCGCCDSPFVVKCENPEEDIDYAVKHLEQVAKDDKLLQDKVFDGVKKTDDDW